jgi:hypothetical protein
MSGATPPLPQYAFMAWCSVKAQGQLYKDKYHDRNCSGAYSYQMDIKSMFHRVKVAKA